MPDLATFEARERQRINGNAGCFAAAAVVITIVFVLSIIFGWRKMAIATIIGPPALLLVPIVYWLQIRNLKQALTRKNPASVIEFFVRDLNEMLAKNDSMPVFAYEALSPATRGQAGDLETFTRVLRTSLIDSIASGLAPEITSGVCAKCNASLDYVVVPSDCSALKNSPVRCDHCRAVYCATCAPELLKDEDKLFADHFLCGCGKKLASSNSKLLAREQITEPYLKIGNPQRKRDGEREDVRLDALAMYRKTGVTKHTMSGSVAQAKSQSLVTGSMTGAFPMRRVNEQWFIDAMPSFVNEAKPVKERWVEAPDQDPF